MSDFGWKVKGQPWPLELSLNISSENNDFGFNSIKKSTFPKNKNKFKANLTFMLSRTRSTYDHHLNKLGKPHIPNVTYQVPRSSAFWFWRRRFLKGFWHIWTCRPSWSCDQANLNTSWLTYCKKSSYEFDFNWSNGFWENYVLIYWWDSNMSALAGRSKVNLDLCNLFIDIVTLHKTYQVRIMTLASIVFKKSTFQKFPH